MPWVLFFFFKWKRLIGKYPTADGTYFLIPLRIQNGPHNCVKNPKIKQQIFFIHNNAGLDAAFANTNSYNLIIIQIKFLRSIWLYYLRWILIELLYENK